MSGSPTGPSGALRLALCAAGRRLLEADLIAAAEGNLSARLPGGTFLVTPSGVSKVQRTGSVPDCTMQG